MSFMRKGVWGGVLYEFNVDNYFRVFDPLYFKVLLSSLKLATMTALSCLVIGYPMSWFMTCLNKKLQKISLVLVMLPFMSNFVVRAYAVKFLIGVEGPFNQFMSWIGWINQPMFLDSPQFAIWIGMVTNYLPFLVLPLFVALDRFDKKFIEAAQDLGGNSWDVWTKILWPLTKKPAMTGFALVFVPAVGEFIIPDLMGGGKTMYFGNLLAEQFLKSRDWPFGAAICVLMFVSCIGLSMLWWQVSTYFNKVKLAT
jgi:spermidine/putrescine transport system permease protein